MPKTEISQSLFNIIFSDNVKAREEYKKELEKDKAYSLAEIQNIARAPYFGYLFSIKLITAKLTLIDKFHSLPEEASKQKKAIVELYGKVDAALKHTDDHFFWKERANVSLMCYPFKQSEKNNMYGQRPQNHAYDIFLGELAIALGNKDFYALLPRDGNRLHVI